MVKYNEEQLNLAFSSLSDPFRRAILLMLCAGPATVSEIADPFNISLPAISRHLKVLERADLLTRRREGRHIIIELNAEPLKDAVEWLTIYEKFWDKQLDQLADFLDKTEEADAK